LPSDVSAEELDKRGQKAGAWANGVYQWSKQNLGDAAADILTERQQAGSYSTAHGSTELNHLLNFLFSVRSDIKKLLLNSDMWDTMHK
jgi:hypothetical protein